MAGYSRRRPVAWNQAVPGPQCQIGTTTLRRRSPTAIPQVVEKRDETLDDWGWKTSTIVSDGQLIATDYIPVSSGQFFPSYS